MGWSFRRRIKVIPGVYLNVSKRGISTSLGVHGASLTFRNDGVYSNVSIPGTGLCNRQKISGRSSRSGGSRGAGSGNAARYPQLPSDARDPDYEFISADPLEISSPGLEGFQAAVIEANRQRSNLQKDLSSIRTSIFISNALILFFKIILIYFIFSRLRSGLLADLNAKRRAARDVEHSICNSSVPLAVDLDPSSEEKFKTLSDSFKSMASSQLIWDLTSASSINQAKERSAAAMQVDRKTTHLSYGEVPGITSSWKALHFVNTNGGDIFLYPGFFVLYEGPSKLGILDMRDLSFQFTKTHFVETSIIPADSIQVSQVWEKSNKDGSPDRRFSSNRQLPVMEYGELTFSSSIGINEKYLFSNAKAAEEFYRMLVEFMGLIT